MLCCLSTTTTHQFIRNHIVSYRIKWINRINSSTKHCHSDRIPKNKPHAFSLYHHFQTFDHLCCQFISTHFLSIKTGKTKREINTKKLIKSQLWQQCCQSHFRSKVLHALHRNISVFHLTSQITLLNQAFNLKSNNDLWTSTQNQIWRNTLLNIGRLKTVNVPVQQNETLKAINSPCLFIKMHKMY